MIIFCLLNNLECVQLCTKVSSRKLHLIKSSKKREPVGPSERLSVTLRFFFKTSVVLNNYLINSKNYDSSYQYCPPEMIDQETFSSDVDQDSLEIVPLEIRSCSNNYSKDAKQVRENSKDLFSVGPGHTC